MSEQPKQLIKVASVKLKIKDKIIELSIPQALELRDVLNATFPAQKEIQYVPVPSLIHVPCIIEKPIYPVGPYWGAPDWQLYPHITCEGGSSPVAVMCLNAQPQPPNTAC